MKIIFKQVSNAALHNDKENIKSMIKEDLLNNRPIIPPEDGIINIHLYPDNVPSFKILGTVEDSNNQFLFTFSYYNNSIAYNLSVPSPSGEGGK